jgi:kynurenine formamidase
MKFPYKIVDLTHTVTPTIPTFPGTCGFTPTLVLDYDQCATQAKFRVYSFDISGGAGTHIDSPAHCFAGAPTVDQLSLQNLIVPCVVIDVSEHAHETYKVSVSDIEQFENVHGAIAPGICVFIRTGWDRHWNTPEQYRNNHRFPCVSEQAAAFLLHRGIAGLGIDTLSPDLPSDDFPIHRLLLKAGKYHLENVTNLQHVPAVGAFSLALPPKLEGATEAPVRLIALLPH